MANRFSDYAESTKGWSLFDHDDVTNVWIEALREIERDKQKRNPSALVKLLRTDYPLSDTARDYLAELLERYSLKLKRKHQKRLHTRRAPPSRR